MSILDREHLMVADTIPQAKEGKKCVCHPDTWLIAPPPICDKFSDEGDGCCFACEHDEGCHTPNQEQPAANTQEAVTP